jgi:hypothetical protein
LIDQPQDRIVERTFGSTAAGAWPETSSTAPGNRKMARRFAQAMATEKYRCDFGPW